MKKIVNLLLLLISQQIAQPVTGQQKTSFTETIKAGNENAIVQTSYGKVKGYTHNGLFTYKGIPYAKAARFMAPEKLTAWDGVRSSLTYGPVCPTDATTTVNDEFEFVFQHNWGYMNENCQSLNIWTQKVNDGKKRPVMVWLHGGGFTAGSSIELPSYDGESLARKGDVVVVSLNHRLNVLGFLDLSAYGEKYKSSANAGLLDLVAALQWVKENIAQFGGDPANVTIFGQSGGGGKVSSLMCAPPAKGLFQKAIVQSGSYLSKFAEKEVAQQVSAALLEELKLQPVQVDSLQKISYDILNAAGKVALKKVEAELKAAGKSITGFGLSWGPVLDGVLLPYQPDAPEANAISINIPLLVGSVKNEFAPFMPGTRNITIDNMKSQLEKKYGDKTEAYISAVEKAYPNTTKPSDYLDIDFTFRAGVVRQANQKAVTGAAPVYMYMFSWQSPVNDGIYKAMHCIELPFVFNNIARCEEMTGGGKEAYVLADKMSNAWISFARKGTPATNGLPAWPAYTKQNGQLMIFDNKCEVKSNYDKELLTLSGN